MKLLSPITLVLILGLLVGGCSFFKRDLKSSDEFADAGGGLIAQKDSSIDSGPSMGVTGLEKAREDSFDWNEQPGDLTAKSAPAKDLPLPPRNPAEVSAGSTKTGTNDIWTAPGGSTTPKNVSEQVAEALSAPPIDGSVIEPAPIGKPLHQGMESGSLSMSSEPETSMLPITETSPLGLSGDTSSSQENGSFSLRSSTTPPSGIVGPSLDLPPLPESPSPPGFKTITEDASQSQLSLKAQSSGTSALEDLSRETDKQAANLARAIKPSTLSENRGARTSPSTTSPFMGFQPLNPGTTMGQPDNSGLDDTGPSATDIPAPTRPTSPEPEGNLLAMATEGKGSSDSSPASPTGNTFNPPVSLPDAKTLKDQGIQLYREKKYDQAIQSFRQYLSAYPDEDQEIEWRLAQSLFLGNRWGEAEKEFDKLRGSPRPEFRADAILKLGMIDQKRGNMEGAREQWRRVVESYPRTDAAARASKLLAETP